VSHPVGERPAVGFDGGHLHNSFRPAEDKAFRSFFYGEYAGGINAVDLANLRNKLVETGTTDFVEVVKGAAK